MNTQKERQLQDSVDSFIQLMLYDFPIDKIGDIVADNVTGYGTTVDEKVLEINRLCKIVADQRDQGIGLDIQINMAPVHRRISPNEDTAIFMDEFVISMLIDGVTNVLPLRLTSVFEFNGKTWKLVHLHSSKAVETEGDTWHQDEWKQKNEQLQKLVDERTAELEHKNRELEIEAAMERVRSRTMAMQHSEELSDTSFVLFQQFTALGIVPNRFFIGVVNEEEDIFNIWLTEWGGTLSSQNFSVSFDEPVLVNKIYEAWKRKAKTIEIDIYGEDIVTWNKYLESVGLSVKNRKSVSRLVNSCAIFSKGFIAITTPENATSETIQILERFAGVFDSTYTRFLDLKKAEAQAREAQIEASLEKVRGRAMAMHNSEDLASAIRVFYNELVSLSTVKIIRCGAGLLSKENKIADLSTISRTSNGEIVEVRGKLDLGGYPMLQNVYYNWLSKEEYHHILRGNEIKQYYQYVRKQVSIPDYSDKAVQFAYFPMFSEGSFYVFTENELTEAELQVYRRFTSVLSLTYKRYNDLQKAEAQTRETQIEAALERIRAKAMSMQHTEELNMVIGLLCEQYDILGINPVCAHLSLIDLENDRFSLRLAGKKGARNIGEKIIDLNAMPQWAESVEKWKKSEPQSYQCLVYPLEAMPALMEVLGELVTTMPEESRISVADFPNGNYSCEAINKFGYLGFDHFRAPTEEEIQIVIRFAREFERIYQRFLDLEKAEAQAREAIKQASLERVRGEIASMRTKGDLNRITPLIWKELNVMEVPFIRCGVLIMDKNREIIHTYLSEPDGHSLSAFELDFDSEEIAIGALKHWRKNEIFYLHWDKNQFVDFMKNLIKEGKVDVAESYQGSAAPPESLYLNFLPFTQGMIYVGNISPLSDDKIQLIKALADVFSIAYARYEDFNMLEKVNQDIEATLTELKSTQTQLIQSEKMASLGELTAGIAHEIQNPLNFVNNFSDVNKELITELKEVLRSGKIEGINELLKDLESNEQKINHHGKRAEAIVKGMLQHSRSSSGQKEPTDINVLADEYLRLSYHGLRARDKSFNATLKTDFDESIGKIQIIPQDIGRVILNLITNAFYAVSEKAKTEHALYHNAVNNSIAKAYEPTVSVSTSHAFSKNKKYDPLLFDENVPEGQKRYGEGRSEVILTVKDNGNGISQKVLDKIFQPFFTTKPTGQGTGLGLSLSYDIIKAHGGEIKVETREGEGTEFIIHLPFSL